MSIQIARLKTGMIESERDLSLNGKEINPFNYSLYLSAKTTLQLLLQLQG